ncbi:hypothetical protein [Chitinophaga sp.]|uniref:hypothetical protein n=1 Tax=Chitinophaga sp. TaxID=1869181 RepID=UPI002F95FBBB
MKKVLLLFAVLMASVNLAPIGQATGIIKGSDGNVIPFADIQWKGTDTGANVCAGRMFQPMALSGIPSTLSHC